MSAASSGTATPARSSATASCSHSTCDGPDAGRTGSWAVCWQGTPPLSRTTGHQQRRRHRSRLTLSAPAATNLHGATARHGEIGTFAFYRDTLGFDAQVWQWSSSEERPLLREVGEARDVPDGDEDGADDDRPRREPAHGPDGDFLLEIRRGSSTRSRMAGRELPSGLRHRSAGADVRIASSFSGELDGDGYTISGYVSDDGRAVRSGDRHVRRGSRS